MARQVSSSLAVLALCLWHVSAFTGIGRPAGTVAVGGGPQAAKRSVSTVPGNVEGQGHTGVLHRARGGQLQLFRRRAIAVPQDIKELENQNDLYIVDTPAEPAPKKGLLNAYLRALDNRPIFTKVVTSGVICGVGDIMAQGLSFKQAAVAGAATLGGFVGALQAQRFVIYSVLGAFWIAPVVHYWFDALERVTKSPQGPPKTFAGRMGKALKMVTLDQSIGAPLVNAGMMFFFTYMTAMATGGFGSQAGKKAGVMVRENLWSTMTVCWKVWPIANLINFAFVPANLRVLFMNMVGLGWNIFLSAAVN